MCLGSCTCMYVYAVYTVYGTHECAVYRIELSLRVVSNFETGDRNLSLCKQTPKNISRQHNLSTAQQSPFPLTMNPSMRRSKTV